MQSQLFMLKFLSASLASRWKPRAQSGRWMADSDLPDENSEPPYEHPLPLGEDCAKYTMSVIAMYLQALRLPSKSSNLDRLNKLVEVTSEQVRKSRPTSQTAADEANLALPRLPRRDFRSEDASATNVECKFPLPKDAFSWEITHISRLNNISLLTADILKYLGHIIYFLSVSNWDVVFERCNQKLTQLSQANEDAMDATDLQFLLHCAIDKTRLIRLLNGQLVFFARPKIKLNLFSDFLCASRCISRDPGYCVWPVA